MAGIRCLGEAHGKEWSMYHGDCTPIMAQLPAHSIGFSVYSVPFAQIFVYSESVADLGNTATDEEFFAQYRFAVREKMRITMPGRLTAVHCSDLPSTKWKDGVIGTKRFSDRLSDIHEEAGWTFCRRVTVWRDPVVEMTRSKALNLLYKQLKKDSTKSWPGMPDYILLFRAPGVNAEPVGHQEDEFPVNQWQQWASPVWMDIRQSDTLNVAAARSVADEKHLCPLQLGLIERAVIMWSNPGDIVLSPFAGIGSEGFMSVKQGRKFLGIELNDRYFRVAQKNLAGAERNAVDLFADAAE